MAAAHGGMSRVFSSYCGYDVIAGVTRRDTVLHHHSASKCVANQLEIRRLGTAMTPEIYPEAPDTRGDAEKSKIM